MKKILTLSVLLCMQLYSKPTEERVWRSNSGPTLTASATSIKGETVSLKNKEGRTFKIPLSKLVEEDQKFLKEHFGIKTVESKAGELIDSGRELVKDGELAHPLGKAIGPIDAGNGSNYFLYIPKSLPKDAKVPLFIYNGSAGGNTRAVVRYSEGGERNAWIIASPVESKNGPSHPVKNHSHTKQCLEHLLATLPIDEDKVYFSGNSGGGAMAFYNSLRIKSLGILPFVAYSPDKKYERKHYCYSIGGATDFNRYLTAVAVSKHKQRGMHRFVVGGHTNGPDWVGVEGMVWLKGRYLGDNRRDSDMDDDRLDFESMLIKWIQELKAETPYRAHYWCQFLTNEYNIEGKNAALITPILRELEKDPLNAKYTQGLVALHDFSTKYYASVGSAPPGHTSTRIKKAAEKLASEYAGVPEIEALALELAKPTAKPK